MYKIVISKNGLGYKAVLWKKCYLFFWLPDTIHQTKFGYETNLEETVNTWVKEFNIPIDMVKSPIGKFIHQ
jgi:hypothetical protein